MLKIAFASGKGGAGKTSLSLSFHKYLKNKSIMADCDVDAADAFLLLEKKIIENKPFVSGYKYSINKNACSQCGACVSVCVFDAIKKTDSFFIQPYSCEGCGACQDVCVTGAINKTDNHCGEIYISDTIINSLMIYARLIPGEDNSGKLIHEVRKTAQELALYQGRQYIVIDCPPGIGCPLIASISGIDLLVVIIECSRAGFNDAQRLIEVAYKIKIPVIVITNKSGLNQSIDNEIELFLKDRDIFSAGNIPFNEEFVNILNRKELIIDSKIISKNLKNIYSQIEKKSAQG
jgi:MinD superfamily P-loop ATPase